MTAREAHHLLIDSEVDWRRIAWLRGRALTDARYSVELTDQQRIEADTMCARYYLAHERWAELHKAERQATMEPYLETAQRLVEAYEKAEPPMDLRLKAGLIELRDAKGEER